MKKLTLAIIVLAGMTFVACSSDDDSSRGLPACVICFVSESGVDIEDELCREDFETEDQYEAAVQEFRNAGGSCN